MRVAVAAMVAAMVAALSPGPACGALQAPEEGAGQQAEQVATAAVRGRAADVEVEAVESRALGRNQWIVFVDRSRGADGPHTLHACLVSGARRFRAGCVALPAPEAAGGFAADSLDVQELARDGRALVLLWVSYQGVPAAGADTASYQRLYVVSPAPVPRLAFDLTLSRESDDGTLTADLEWQDMNGDGHPDAVVEQTRCLGANGERCGPSARYVYLWTRAARRWVLRRH